MIELRRPLQIESRTENDASVVLWLCEPFDLQFSFRVVIASLQEVLGTSGPTTIELPPEESGEEFVDGRLFWGARTLEVYFERSLGYLELSSSAEAITVVHDALANQTFVAPGK
jgi:hypothetical protein